MFAMIHHIPGGTRYNPGWGGAARPEFRFLIPCLRHRLKVAVTNCVAFLLCTQWKFNVPGINAKVNGSQY